MLFGKYVNGSPVVPVPFASDPPLCDKAAAHHAHSLPIVFTRKQRLGDLCFCETRLTSHKRLNVIRYCDEAPISAFSTRYEAIAQLYLLVSLPAPFHRVWTPMVGCAENREIPTDSALAPR